MDISPNKNLANLVFIFCLFPYVTPISMGSDVQPYSMFFSLIFLLVFLIRNKSIKIFKPILLLLIPLLYSIVIISKSPSLSSWLRSFYGYLSIFIFSLVAYNSFSLLSGKILVYSVRVWFFFAVIQKTLSKYFGSFIVARMSTSIDRGVTSLAVEPSAFANVCFFMLLINELFYAAKKINKNDYKINMLLLLIQFFLANSAMGYLILLPYILCKIFFSGSKNVKILEIAALITVYPLSQGLVNIVYSLPKNRVTSILFKLMSGQDIFSSDGSIADRMAHILIPLKSLSFNYSLGFGLSTWEEKSYEVIREAGPFIQKIVNTNFSGGRIMSGWGTIFFELGIVSLFILLWYFLVFFLGLKSKSKRVKQLVFIFMISITFTMFMSVTIAFPLFSYSVGLLSYYLNYYDSGKSSIQ